MENEVFNAHQDNQLTSALEGDRSKTSLRLKYEAESTIIREQLGSLEDIRLELGLSRRKMCQLLMVDPSAWTRWTKEGASVPPHIYRSLQWYMALIEKSPSWHPQNTYLGAFRTDLIPKPVEQRLGDFKQQQKSYEDQLSGNVHDSLAKLRIELKTISSSWDSSQQIGFAWKFMVFANSLILGLIALKLIFSS